jgi:hypothetical protein
MDPGGGYRFYCVAFDEAKGMIYAGEAYSPGGWTGVIAISRYGFLRQARYLSGTKSAGWTFGSHLPLVQGLTDYEAVLAEDPGDRSLYRLLDPPGGDGVLDRLG